MAPKKEPRPPNPYFEGRARVSHELQEVQAGLSKDLSFIRDLEIADSSNFTWHALIYLTYLPYKSGAFRFEVSFPADFPFRPPKMRLLTRIYHPNVDESGQLCFPLITPDNWKPGNKISEVLFCFYTMLNDPIPEYPMRPELVEEYVMDRKKFEAHAKAYTRKYGVKRFR